MSSRLVWGSPEWLWPAVGLACLIALAALLGYRRTPASWGVRLAAWTCKLLALAALVFLLGDPQWETQRPVPGANEFWMVADNSESLGLRSKQGQQSRGDQWVEAVTTDPAWLSRLEQDFQVRRFTFDERLHPQQDFREMKFAGQSSQLFEALGQLSQRVRHRPCTGMLLFTDGNATDEPLSDAELRQLPPIYCVLPQIPDDLLDLSVGQVQLTTSNFESAPITVQTEVQTLGNWREPVVVQLLDESGQELQRQRVEPVDGQLSQPIRFQFRPEGTGVQGFQLRTFAERDQADFAEGRSNLELTLANNEQWCVVDRGGGPFRILYLAGRSNWEYKFLQRAVHEDDEIDLVGLLRVARREPRFAFRGGGADANNPLYQGFDPETEEAERYDQPVMIRLETRDVEELKKGFPQTAPDLFGYHALVLDDIEAEFFSADQHQLVRDFVTRRGGALLMLGGPETFREGKYQDTPIGTIIPLYLDAALRPAKSLATGGSSSLPAGLGDSLGAVESSDDDSAAGEDDLFAGDDTPSLGSGPAPAVPYRLDLTREGWLEPWMRLHENSTAEQSRLARMPVFYNPSLVGEARPGASLLATLDGADGAQVPLLVTQRYGAGKTVAVTAADLWRWEMLRDNPDAQPKSGRLPGTEKTEKTESSSSDGGLGQFWRQVIRWLVSDVTPRIKAETKVVGSELVVDIRVLDPTYEPTAEAEVELRVKGPDGAEFTLTAQPSTEKLGEYRLAWTPALNGFYRATIVAHLSQEEKDLERPIGWTWSPGRTELAHLLANRRQLERIAQATGGAVWELNELPTKMLEMRPTERTVMEPVRDRLWHRWWWLTLMLTALVGEWGLRRWHGLA